ncbi:MAG: Prespore specific transcriptional activator RsfA [Brockia lithotrophica]|uniref:Prespore specific transcriptional activator RsfA n=1 Tax=Brockia lithotrophica TaxID=933949 RepID=A0A2T5G488_9BACL|nr:hypothetical protein [Brockia lithotrophica]MBT9253625.1 hypothetical protein [Brockia lithotrophica]PTQ50988.1 MAG: Prespore specific transcriptional activator RsfA [Brockia lithotrophica]
MAQRQDAWSEGEDVLLAELVLKSIREGGTQLEAFREAAQRLGRTPAACGFRWNAVLRRRYAEDIRLAKMARRSRRLELARSWADGESEHKTSPGVGAPSSARDASDAPVPAEGPAQRGNWTGARELPSADRSSEDVSDLWYLTYRALELGRTYVRQLERRLNFMEERIVRLEAERAAAHSRALFEAGEGTRNFLRFLEQVRRLAEEKKVEPYEEAQGGSS